MRYLLLLVFILFLQNQSGGQDMKRISIPEYIELYKNDAIKDMMRMGVPASITLAQGILESESGNSDLARQANNHFGIKCHKEWTGATFHKDDDERDECFRSYNSVLESFDDHGRFLRERSRYAFLFDLEITDYKGWAHGLKKAGYATNPRYAELLIRLIENHNLAVYDKGGVKIPISQQVTSAGVTAPRVNNDNKEVTKPVQSVKQVMLNKNDVPYYIAKNGDSWFSVAAANDMRLWQLLKYNDADKGLVLSEGDIVYLKPKRGRPAVSTHVLRPGETLWMVSQQYGVKLKKLQKLNGYTATPGSTIKLR